MLRMSFNQKLAENVGEHSLSMFMHVHVSGLHTQLVFILSPAYTYFFNAYALVFFSSYECMFQHAYTYKDPTQAYANLRAHDGT